MSVPTYGHKWRKARATYLLNNGNCVRCLEAGRNVIATVVDHIVPHRGNWTLFWDSSNWQSLCKTCHDGSKQRDEHTGHQHGCDVNGNPYQPQRYW